MSTIGVISLFLIGSACGFVVCMFFCANKIDALQRQVDTKSEIWCQGCQTKTDLENTRADLKAAKELIDSYKRSNGQFASALKRKTYGRV